MWQKSVEAMKKVEEIRSRRAAHFITSRHSKAKEVQRRSDAYEVTKNIGLIRSPAAGLKKLSESLESNMDMELIPIPKLKQMESRIVEEIHDSDKEMDAE